MHAIKSGAMDTKTRIRLKRELLDLQKEYKRVEKLMNIAKPNLSKLHTQYVALSYFKWKSQCLICTKSSSENIL